MTGKSSLLAFAYLLMAAIVLSVTAASGWLLVYLVDWIGRGDFGFWLGALLVCGVAVSLGVLLLSLLFWIPIGRHRPVERALGDAEQGRLKALAAELSEKLSIAPPRAIVSNGDINAYASYNGGLPGLLRNGTKLTVGEPVLLGLPSEFIRPILAHELGHFRDAPAMRAIALSFEIEGGLKRATSFASLSIRRWHLRKQRLTALSVVGLAYFSLCEEVLSALLAPVWILAKRVFRKVEEEMEYRADVAAAELCGAEAVIDAMKALGALAVALGEEGSRDGADLKEKAARFRAGLGKGSWRRVRFPEESIIARRMARLSELATLNSRP